LTTFCLARNATLAAVAKSAIMERLLPDVQERHGRFTACLECGRV